MAKAATAHVVVDYVYSPDDGGWYAQESDLTNVRSRVTRKIYSTKEAARKAAEHRGPWEAWS